MTNSHFTHINEEFECAQCGCIVPVRKKSCRNHCPFCLSSKHVDINPGDRSNPCKGLMRAYGYEQTSHKGLILLFKCDACGVETRNIAAHEDPICPDDYDLILTLKPQIKP